MYANIEIHGHVGSCPRYALLIVHGKATKPRENEFRERVERIIERTLAGEARMENLGRRSQDGYIQGQYLWEKTSPREEKSSNLAKFTGCA